MSEARSIIREFFGDYPGEWQLDSLQTNEVRGLISTYSWLFYAAIANTVVGRLFFWPPARHGVYIWIYLAGLIFILVCIAREFSTFRKDSQRRKMKLVRMYQHGWTHPLAFDHDFPGFDSPLVGFWSGTWAFGKAAAKSWPDYRDGKPTSIPFPTEPVKYSIIRAAKKYPCPCPGPHVH